MAFVNPWDETVPPVGEDARDGYARIIEVKKGVRERINVEHETDTDGSGEWRHKMPLMTRVERDAVTGTVDGWMIFRSDINAVQVQDSGDASGWRTFYGAFVGETKEFQGHINDIPIGWYLSDGGTYNGFVTADLQGLFVVGSAPGSAGDYDTDDPVADPKTGGATLVVIAKANIERFESEDDSPDHTHTVTPRNGGSGAEVAGDDSSGTGTPLTTSGATRHKHFLGTTGATGAENRPPYYALAKIVYCGLGALD